MLYRNGDEWLDTLPYVNNGGLWVPVESGYVKNGETFEQIFGVEPGPWENITFTHVYRAPGTAVDPFTVLGKTSQEFDTDPTFEWENITATSLGTLTPGEWGPWDTVVDPTQEQTTTDGNPPAAQGTVPTDTATDEYRWLDWVNVGSEFIESAWGNWETVTLPEEQFGDQFPDGTPPDASNITLPANTSTKEHQNPAYVFSRHDTVKTQVGELITTLHDPDEYSLMGLTSYWNDTFVSPIPIETLTPYNPNYDDIYTTSSSSPYMGSLTSIKVSFKPGTGFTDGYYVWSSGKNPNIASKWSTQPPFIGSDDALVDNFGPGPEDSPILPPENPNYFWFNVNDKWGETLHPGTKVFTSFSNGIDITLEEMVDHTQLSDVLSRTTFRKDDYPGVVKTDIKNLPLVDGFTEDYWAVDDWEIVDSVYGSDYFTIKYFELRWRSSSRIKVWGPKIGYIEAVYDNVYYWNPTYEKRERDPALEEITWHGRYEHRSVLGSWGPWLEETITTDTTGDNNPPSTLPTLPANTSSEEYRNPHWTLEYQEDTYGAWGEWEEVVASYDHASLVVARGLQFGWEAAMPVDTYTAEYRNVNAVRLPEVYEVTYQKRTRPLSTIYHWNGVVEKRTLLGDWGLWLDTDLRPELGAAGSLTTSTDTTPTDTITLPPNTEFEEYRNPYWAYNGYDEDYGTWSEWNSVNGQRITRSSSELPDNSQIFMPSDTSTEEYRNPQWSRDGSTLGDWGSWRKVTDRSYTWYSLNDGVPGSWNPTIPNDSTYLEYDRSTQAWTYDGIQSGGTYDGHHRWHPAYYRRSRSRSYHYRATYEQRIRSSTATHYWFVKAEKRTNTGGSNDEVFRIAGRRRRRA